jgi:hypothetical protein
MKIPCLYFDQPDGMESAELHVFCDASIVAYAAVAYLRARTSEGFSSRLVASKTRVAPLEKTTIPRLELLGAVLATFLADYIVNALQKPNIATYLWTDSLITLHWIRGDIYKWKTFVRNRVETIRKSSSIRWWRFCPGEENPADLGSRGTTASELTHKTIWIHGPPWLRKDCLNWPKMDPNMFSPSVNEIEEEKKELPITTTIVVDESSHIDAAKFSSFKKMVRVTSWILRYVFNLKTSFENRRLDQELSLEEIVNAETFWIKKVQEERFSAELAELRKGNVSKT